MLGFMGVEGGNIARIWASTSSLVILFDKFHMGLDISSILASRESLANTNDSSSSLTLLFSLYLSFSF